MTNEVPLKNTTRPGRGKAGSADGARQFDYPECLT